MLPHPCLADSAACLASARLWTSITSSSEAEVVQSMTSAFAALSPSRSISRSISAILRATPRSLDLKSLGLRTGTRDDILTEIARVFRLAESE